MGKLYEFSLKFPPITESAGADQMEAYLCSLSECVMENTACPSMDDAVGFLLDSIMTMAKKNRMVGLPEAHAKEEDCRGWLREAQEKDYTGKLMTRAFNRFGPKNT